MSLVDKAWEILQKVGPFRELDDFIQKLRETFDDYEDLSPDEAKAKKAEIKTKMLQQIQSDPHQRIALWELRSQDQRAAS